MALLCILLSDDKLTSQNSSPVSCNPVTLDFSNAVFPNSQLPANLSASLPLFFFILASFASLKRFDLKITNGCLQ
jgi:hypothetical protein